MTFNTGRKRCEAYLCIEVTNRHDCRQQRGQSEQLQDFPPHQRKRGRTAEDSGAWATYRGTFKNSTYKKVVHITSHKLTFTHFPTTHKNPFQTRYHKNTKALSECDKAEEETCSRVNVWTDCQAPHRGFILSLRIYRDNTSIQTRRTQWRSDQLHVRQTGVNDRHSGGRRMNGADKLLACLTLFESCVSTIKTGRVEQWVHAAA